MDLTRCTAVALPPVGKLNNQHCTIFIAQHNTDRARKKSDVHHINVVSCIAHYGISYNKANQQKPKLPWLD